MQEQNDIHDEALVEHQLKFCTQLLLKLRRNRNAYPFLEPVDPIKLGVPDYPLKVKHPMDLSTIKKKLDQKIYKSPSEYESDIRLMFNNCYSYNHPSSEVYLMGKNLEQAFDEMYILPDSVNKKKRKIEPVLKQSKRVIRSTDTMNIDDYEFCLEVITELYKSKYKSFAWPFYEPIDDALLPQYYEIIKHPICLREIKDKLDQKMYYSIEDFQNDLKLIVDNCHKFNEHGTDIYNFGTQFNDLVVSLMSNYEPKDIKGRIIELKKKIAQYTREIKLLESKIKDNNIPSIRNYTLNERIELGNRILNLNKSQTDHVAKIIQKHSAGEYVENNEVEVDLRILPDNVYEEIDAYISKIEIGMEEGI